MTYSISEDNWRSGYEDVKLLFVNYQYHKDVCSKSLERYNEIKYLKKTISSVLLGLECIYKDELKSSQTMGMVKHQIETLKGNNVLINKRFSDG